MLLSNSILKNFGHRTAACDDDEFEAHILSLLFITTSILPTVNIVCVYMSQEV